MAVLKTSLYEYVYYYLLTNVFRKLFHSDDSKQINQVTQTILKEALIPLPPFQEQSRISSAIKSLFSYVDSFDANKKELTEIISQTRSKILDQYYHYLMQFQLFLIVLENHQKKRYPLFFLNIIKKFITIIT